MEWKIAGAWTDRQVVRRHGFQIVVEHIRLGGDNALQGARLAQEVRRQDFDRCCRRGGADRPDHLLEMLSTAVFQIVAVDRGDDDVGKAHLLHGLGDVLRLCHVERVRLASRDVTEGAGNGYRPRPMITKVACFLSQHSPIFATSGFFADGDELVFLHDRARFGIALRGRGLDADPVRLAHDFRIGAVRLFRMPHALDVGIDRVENGYHCRIDFPPAPCGFVIRLAHKRFARALQFEFVMRIIAAPSRAMNISRQAPRKPVTK